MMAFKMLDVMLQFQIQYFQYHISSQYHTIISTLNVIIISFKKCQ